MYDLSSQPGRILKILAGSIVTTADPADRPAQAANPSRGGNPLQRLIQARLHERGWSYGVVARRGGLPRSTVYNLASTDNLVRPPRPETIEKLARGLDLPETAVRAAAAEATGLHLNRDNIIDDETAILIASIEELTPDDRRVIAKLIESLRARTARPEDPTA